VEITRNLSQCSWDARQHQYNFGRRLCWSISSNCSENSLSKCAPQPKIAKNSLKPLFLEFKVVQSHRCWYHWKARQQCLLWYAASLCLPATSSPSGTKLPHKKLETIGYLTVKTRSFYLTWAWFGTGSWHPRQTDRRTDRQTDRIPIANTRSQQYLPVQCRA